MNKVLCVRFKRQIRGFDPDENSACPQHTAVGRAIKHLDHLARVQSWQPLSAFISEDPDIAIDLIDDEEEEALVDGLPPLRWFAATDALATTINLIDALKMIPRRLPLTEKNVAKIVAELKDIRATLEKAAERKVPFRFYAEFG